MYRKITLVFLFIISYLGIYGQQTENSPYSRFGLGEIADNNFNHLRQMGGLGASFIDAYHINIVNPASYSFLSATAFDVGLFAKYSSYSDNAQTSRLWSGNLEYLALAFPLKNPINEIYDGVKQKYKLGMAFALMPHSNVSYNILSTNIDPNLGQIERNYIGTGGTYKFMWGNSIKYKDISFGVNLGYLFGKTTYQKNLNFIEQPNSYNNRFSSDYNVNGFLWNAGLMYTKILNQKAIEKNRVLPAKRISLGIHGNSANGFNTTSNVLEIGEQRLPNLTNRDTIQNQIEQAGKGKLPAELGLGMTYYSGEKYSIGVNYHYSNWASYFNDANKEIVGSLANASKISLGGYYRPNYKSFDNFFERVYYRYGVFYQLDPREINGQKLNEYGFSVGLGMPFVFQRKISNVNLGAQFGQRGTNLPISEKYVKISLGVTFNDDEWFLKRKYN